MRPPLIGATSKNVPKYASYYSVNLSLKWGHPSNQDTLTGPKGGWIRGSTYCMLSQVLLKTTFGDMDIELWSKEAPLACRNFVQLCMEGYYNGTMFHRIIPDFIAQGGDPTGTGEGGCRTCLFRMHSTVNSL